MARVPGPLLLALLTIALATGAWAPAAEAVTPQAKVQVTNLNVNGVPDHVGDRTVYATLLPASDWSGNATMVLRLTIGHHNGTGEPLVMERQMSLHVPPPGERDRYHVLAEPAFQWAPDAGMYRLRMELLGVEAGVEAKWDDARVLHRVGTGPNLSGGWGYARGAAPTVDLTGDGRADLIMENASNPRPGPGEAATWTVYAEAAPWESTTHHGWQLRLSFHAPRPVDNMTLRLSEAAARAILQAGADTPIHLDPWEGVAPQAAREGWYAYRVTADTPGHRGYYELYAKTNIRRDLPQGWHDGYQTRFNLTAWDIDGDGFPNMRFWEGDAPDAPTARNLTEAARRDAPAQLRVEVVVNDTPRGRQATLDVRRGDGGHGGAWVEVRDESALKRALTTNATDPDAPLAYELSLPPGEGFVERGDDETWVWFGHFSTQRLQVLAPAASGGGVHDPPPPPRETPAPGLGPAAAAALLALLLHGRRRLP